jgi:CheY-like chemotaxis protein
VNRPTIVLDRPTSRFERRSWRIFDAAHNDDEAATVENRVEAQNDSPEDVAVALGPILIVDDDRTIREIVAETLELEGYPVVQAANGAEALAQIAHKLPSLVLLDMRMPVLDGWGVARALRDRGIRLPIVVLTAAHNARAWANEIGAIAYLAKPFEDTDLLATVERCRGKFPSE